MKRFLLPELFSTRTHRHVGRLQMREGTHVDIIVRYQQVADYLSVNHRR